MRVVILLVVLLSGCDPYAIEHVPLLPEKLTTPVRVYSKTEDHFRCSGLQIHKDFALTAAHCVEEPMWVDGLPVKIVMVPNLEWDMAILHVPGLEGGDVEWAAKKPDVGDEVFIVGWGCSASHTRAALKRGLVESIDGRDLTLTAEVCHGDSGSAAFDREGRLYGLVSRLVERDHHAVAVFLAE